MSLEPCAQVVQGPDPGRPSVPSLESAGSSVQSSVVRLQTWTALRLRCSWEPLQAVSAPTPAMVEVERIPRSTDSMRVYALPVPRMRSPHRTQEQLRAESAAIAAPNPYVPPAAGSDAERDRAVDQLLAFGARRIAVKRLITGHAETNTRLTFEFRDKKFSGTVSRRDLIRCCRSLDLGWSKEQLALIADRFQLADSNRCAYAGLVGALHRNDPHKEATRRAQAAARASKRPTAESAIAQQRAEAQRLLDERAPLSVPSSGPLTQPLASPVLVRGNWWLAQKRPDQCQIGYERCRLGRRAFDIESSRDSRSTPPWDSSITAGSGSVRENVTSHGDRHFPVRQLLTPRGEPSDSKADGEKSRGLHGSRSSEQSSSFFIATSSRHGDASSRSDTACSPSAAQQLDNEYDPPAVERLGSNQPIKVDMAVQAELEGPRELQPEPEPISEISARTAPMAAAAGSGSGKPDLVEVQPACRDLMWDMLELDQEVSLEVVGLKLFNKLPAPKHGRKHPRAPYVKITYAHRMWKTRRATKTSRSGRSLNAERLRPETPEELARFRKVTQESSMAQESSMMFAEVASRDQLHLSPRTGAYVDLDSPFSVHVAQKREQSQIRAGSPEVAEGGGSKSPSWNFSESSLTEAHDGGLNKTRSTPELVSSKLSVDPGTATGPKPWNPRPSSRATRAPKKEWAWEWSAARCSWQLMKGPDGNPPSLTIALHADDEYGYDTKIGAVSVSMNEIIAGCATGAPMWFRILSATRGTRTHKWQGAGNYHQEENDDPWSLPELKTTTHAAIGAVKLAFSGLDWQLFPRRQKSFCTVLSVQLAEEQKEKRAQQEIVAEEGADVPSE